MLKIEKKTFFIGLFFLAVTALPNFVFADSYNQKTTFFVDSSYDLSGREKIEGALKHISVKAYFYLEEEWWESLSDKEKQEILNELSLLGKEFDQKIYPTVTSVYGHEWTPGIDGDRHITVFLHQMKENIGGYHRTIDEYYKIQVPSSNQREMVYLNSDYLGRTRLKSFLAHEFVHLIVFNQKVKVFKTGEEEVWLNEAYADYAPTLLGYDDQFDQESNLYNRVREFLGRPSDSLTEWRNTAQDYGVVNLFTQYLVDHYGIEILEDALRSKKTGIDSLNYALEKNGYKKTVKEIFSDWTIALVINDCSVNSLYCYENDNLKNVRITPALIFIPTTQQSEISLVYSLKDWSARWLKIIGGDKGLEVEIENNTAPEVTLSYVIRKNGTEIEIQEAAISKGGVVKIKLPEFAKENVSLVLIPSVTHKTKNFADKEASFSFSVKIKTVEENNHQEKPITEMTIEELQAKILEIQQQIARLQTILAELIAQNQSEISCKEITKNLYYGIMNDPQVRCLQEFLKSQGLEIYPQGLITGNFLELTRQAVIRFQEKYKEEILEPLGLENGTGFVGSLTRKKINEMLNAGTF